MPVYIFYDPKNGGIYTRQEMETTYKTSVNKRKFRTFTAWVNALEKSGQLEIAQEDKTMKGYVIIASNGAEVIDTRPEAESLIIAMDEEEQLYNARQKRRESERQRKLSYKLFHKVACACGIMQKSIPKCYIVTIGQRYF